MIPEAWENHADDVAGEARLLPLPRVADGAVGRPGVDRVHRRHRDRRGARPQRAAPEPLLGHRRRPRDHGQRGRRGRRRPGARGEEGAAAAGPHVPRRHRAGAHRRRRGDQGEPGRRAARTASGSTQGLVHLDDLPDREHVVYSHESVLRRQETFGYTHEELKLLVVADGADRRRGASARWAPTRRSRCSPTARGMLFDYFQQLFAQVTNPPLDAIREELVTSLSCHDRRRGQPARRRGPSRACRSSCRSRSSTTTSWPS